MCITALALSAESAKYELTSSHKHTCPVCLAVISMKVYHVRPPVAV